MHNDRISLPMWLTQELERKKGVVSIGKEGAKSLDLYAFGAALYIAFFNHDTSLDNGQLKVSSLKFKPRGDIQLFSPAQQRYLKDLICKLTLRDSKLSASEALRHSFFLGLSSSNGHSKHLHIYDAFCQQPNSAGNGV